MPLVSRLGAASSRGFGEFAQQTAANYVEDVFSTYLYTGNGSTQTITNGIDLAGKGGLVWIKARNTAGYNHALFDTARGVNNRLKTDTTDAQNFASAYNNTFNSDGFAIGAQYVDSGVTYASWTFRKAPKFFDVVTYTGNGSTSAGGKQVSHSLGDTPGFVIIKRTDTAANWVALHRSSPTAGKWAQLYLNTTGSLNNDFSPTSMVTSTYIDVALLAGGSNGTLAELNANGGTYVAYLFAHDTTADGVIQCGSFTGSASEVSVSLGWEPQFILVKNSTSTGDWVLFDSMRELSQTNNRKLNPNLSDAETSYGTAYFKPTATGFTATGWGSGSTHIYLAIRRGPMRVPTDATKVFTPISRTGTGAAVSVTSFGSSPDAIIIKNRANPFSLGPSLNTRLVGRPWVASSTTSAEVSPTSSNDFLGFDVQNGYRFGVQNDQDANDSSYTYVNYGFARAPGFVDVTCYTGTGSTRTVSHNLTVVPEMIWTKDRSVGSGWAVYAAPLGAGKFLELSETAVPQTSIAAWNDTAPTSSVFTVRSQGSTNASGRNYVAYLFASCPGVSKVGSYTGTGTTQQINCGFTAGARFVLIKRTDTTGDWYVYDSARGIVAGNDPYLLLNSTAAEVTNTDYVDTYSAGFELSSTAPAGLNEAPGITWIGRTSGFGTNSIYGVTYGNNLYVAGGVGGTLTTSPDSVTWTARTSGFGTTDIYNVGYGNGLFIAVGAAGKLTTSPDGITWTSRTSGFGTTEIYSVAYGNGIYVAVGDAGKMTTSTDGITWTSRTSGFGTTKIYDVTYGNGLFVAVGDSGTMTTSTDGITWTSRTSGFGTTLIRRVTYGNGLYVAVGDVGKMTTSTDGVTWTSRTSGFGTKLIIGVNYGNGTYVAVGENATLTTSTDGITWTARTSGFTTTIPIYSVAFGNGIFVAVSDNGEMRTNNPNYIYLAIA